MGSGSRTGFCEESFSGVPINFCLGWWNTICQPCMQRGQSAFNVSADIFISSCALLLSEFVTRKGSPFHREAGLATRKIVIQYSSTLDLYFVGTGFKSQLCYELLWLRFFFFRFPQPCFAATEIVSWNRPWLSSLCTHDSWPYPDHIWCCITFAVKPLSLNNLKECELIKSINNMLTQMDIRNFI
jgi:hypothetical protein